MIMVQLLLHLLAACALRSVMGATRSINDTLRVSPGGRLWDGIFSLDGSTLYVTDTDFKTRENSLTATGVKDGKVAWTYHGDELNYMAMSPDGSAVYTGRPDTSLQALDARSGKVLWTFSTGSDIDPQGDSPAVSPDSKVVYAGGLSTTDLEPFLYALNATDGSERWHADMGIIGMDFPPVVSPDGSAVYATTGDAELHAFSAEDGSLLWKVDITSDWGFFYSSLSPDGKVVYVVGHSGQAIYAFDAFDASSGARLWNVTLHDMPYSPAASSPNGSLVVVTYFIIDDDNHPSVHALRRSNGEGVWSAAVGPGASTSAAFSPDGSVVFVGGQDGLLYALDASDGTVMWTGSTTDAAVSVGPIVSPDGKSVAVGSGGSIFIFPTEVTRQTRTRSLRSSQA